MVSFKVGDRVRRVRYFAETGTNARPYKDMTIGDVDVVCQVIVSDYNGAPTLMLEKYGSGHAVHCFELVAEPNDGELAAEFRELMRKACDVNDELMKRGYDVTSEVGDWRTFKITKTVAL